MSEVLLCFCLYYSTVVCAVFLGNFHREVYKIPRAMLYMIPAAPAFYLIYTWSRTIPDAVAGMLVKTILSRITFSLALCKGMNRPFLITFLETYLVMPVIAFTEILLSSVVDLSAFTGPLSDQTSVIGNSIIQLAASTVEILLAWPVSSALRNVLEKRVIPFRYTLLAFTSLVTVSVQGALFFFLNVSDKPIPSLVLAGLAFISLITLCGSLYLMFNEAVARKSASRLPFFTSAQESLKRQLIFLDRQAEWIKAAQTSVKDYRKAGDLSRSIDKIFEVHNRFKDSLYTDNPVINTLLQYYASHFKEAGIPFSFSITCSTYTPFSDYLMICLLSGLLDLVRGPVSLSLARSANVYEIRLHASGISGGAVSLLTETVKTIAQPETEVLASHQGADTVFRLISPSVPAENGVN